MSLLRKRAMYRKHKTTIAQYSLIELIQDIHRHGKKICRKKQTESYRS